MKTIQSKDLAIIAVIASGIIWLLYNATITL
jgi:hypothetical protein